MDKPSRKSFPFSQDQKVMLVEFMEQHPQLISGRFDSNFTYKKASGLWEEVTLMINAIPGAKKDWKSWRKTWHDMRTRTKGKQSKINKYARGTGGGPVSGDQLDSTESKIVALIGNTAISGHKEITESQALSISSSGSHKEISTPKEATIVLRSSPIPCSSNEQYNEQTEEMLIGNQLTERSPSPATNFYNSTQQNNVKEVPIEKISAKRRMATQRLHRTVTATEKLAAQCEIKNKNKKEYFDKKIELLERELIIKERIAKALETIANKLI